MAENTIRQRILAALGGVPVSDVEQKIEQARRRAFEAGREAADVNADEPVLRDSSGAPIAQGYSEQGAKKRDLSAISQEKAIEASYRIWQTNPLGNALTEIIVDYVVGDGIQVVSDNDDVREVIERFIDDPANNLQENGFEEIARELSLFGEQVILLFPRYGNDDMLADGLVRYGTVDPSMIKSIVTHPENNRDVYAVRLKDVGGQPGKLYMVLRDEQDAAGNMREGAIKLAEYANAVRVSEAHVDVSSLTRRVPANAREWLVYGDDAGRLRVREADSSPAGEQYDGQCILAQVNKLSTGTRGRPDLLPELDWLDQMDTVFFDGVEHVALLNLFAWDLLVEGGSGDSPDPDTNLTIQAQRVARLKTRSVYAHNEGVTLTAVTPDLKTAELETIARSLRIFIAGGARIPEHWLAEGGYTNRATAQEMGQPTFRMLTSRQRVLRGVYTRMIQYAIDVAVSLGQLDEYVTVETEAGTEKVKARDAFTVIMPEINVADTDSVSMALLRVTQSVISGIAAKVLPRSTGIELLSRLLGMLGIDADPQEMEDEIAEMSGVPFSEIGDGGGAANDIADMVADVIAQLERETPPPTPEE